MTQNNRHNNKKLISLIYIIYAKPVKKIQHFKWQLDKNNLTFYGI